jgi:hypothetical protein
MVVPIIWVDCTNENWVDLFTDFWIMDSKISGAVVDVGLSAQMGELAKNKQTATVARRIGVSGCEVVT